jgi:hypothetical protein
MRQLEEQLTNEQGKRDGPETVLVNGKDWNAKKADSPKSMIPKVT